MENKKFNSLAEIFSDSFFLENLAPKAKAKPLSYDNRLIAEFEEINDFIEKNGKIPEKTRDLHERKLASRLSGILLDIQKIQYLQSYDRHGILEKKFGNFSDILDDFQNF